MFSAKQIDMIKEQAYCKVPTPFVCEKFICNVYPYSINEIVSMPSSRYDSRLALLLLTEADISETIKKKTGKAPQIESIEPLSYLLQSASYDDKFLLELKCAFSTFIKEEVLLLPKINSVLVGGDSAAAIQEKRLITPQNFRDFQDILRIQNRKEVVPPPPENETPGQRKMRLLREQVAAVKKKQAQKKGEGQTLCESMEIASVFGIDRNESLYAFYAQIRRHQMKEKWEADIQMLCAGADSKKLDTKYWGEKPED